MTEVNQRPLPATWQDTENPLIQKFKLHGYEFTRHRRGHQSKQFTFVLISPTGSRICSTV